MVFATSCLKISKKFCFSLCTITNTMFLFKIEINSERAFSGPIYLASPILGPLLFANNDSDARDHSANERTFLSWLRLSMYLSVVACAIILSFHLRSEPTRLERLTALPVGILFWLLSMASLCSGFAIYLQTMTKYSRKLALVQSGWKTQTVVLVVACVIIGTCVFLLSTNKRRM